jgi:hypothetical protein
MCDNRVSGADTLGEAVKLVKGAMPFGGPYDP